MGFAVVSLIYLLVLAGTLSSASTSANNVAQDNEPFGTLLGVTDGGVEVYSCNYDTLDPKLRANESFFDAYLNGTYTGMKWQCVELARRYLLVNWGVVFESIPNAYDIFPLKSVTRVTDDKLFTLRSFPNGSSTLPVRGSLLIWEPVGEFVVTGHVAVVVDVRSDHVDVAEQNVLNAIWPAGRNYSRRLRATLDRPSGAYHIFCTYPDTRLLGWMTPDLNHPYTKDESSSPGTRNTASLDVQHQKAAVLLVVLVTAAFGIR